MLILAAQFSELPGGYLIEFLELLVEVTQVIEPAVITDIHHA